MNPYFQQCCLIIYVPETQYAFSAELEEFVKTVAAFPVHLQLFYEDVNAVQEGLSALTDEKFLLTPADRYQQLDEAFRQAFEKGFRKVVVLKSDVKGFLPKYLEEAFFSLKILEFSIGPRTDGGIYLLGMNHYEPFLFKDQHTSDIVHSKTLIRNMGILKMALYKLPVLGN